MNLASAQRRAEALMTEPCRVRRPGKPTTDPLTGRDTPTYSATPYTGGCRIQVRNTLARAAQATELTVAVSSLEVHLPAGSGPYRVGDVVEILTQPGGTVTRTLRMVGRHDETFQTAQRVPVEEV